MKTDITFHLLHLQSSTGLNAYWLDFLILITRHYFNHLHVIVCRLIRSFPITTKSTRRVWPVSRKCYYLYGSWSYLFFYSFVFYQLLFCTALGAFFFNTVHSYHRSCMFLINACFQTKYKYYKDQCISTCWCKKKSCSLNTSDFKAMRWS